jgi:hypothetical protein
VVEAKRQDSGADMDGIDLVRVRCKVVAEAKRKDSGVEDGIDLVRVRCEIVVEAESAVVVCQLVEDFDVACVCPPDRVGGGVDLAADS